MNFYVPKKMPRFLIMVLSVFLMSLSCEAMQPYGAQQSYGGMPPGGMGGMGGMPQGGGLSPGCQKACVSPMCRPMGCIDCCQKKHRPASKKFNKCINACQKRRIP